MDSINRVRKDYGIKINVKKTKAMCISRKGENNSKIYIDKKTKAMCISHKEDNKLKIYTDEKDNGNVYISQKKVPQKCDQLRSIHLEHSCLGKYRYFGKKQSADKQIGP